MMTPRRRPIRRPPRWAKFLRRDEENRVSDREERDASKRPRSRIHVDEKRDVAETDCMGETEPEINPQLAQETESSSDSLIISSSRISRPNLSFGLGSNCQCSSRSTSVTALTANIPPEAPTEGTPAQAEEGDGRISSIKENEGEEERRTWQCKVPTELEAEEGSGEEDEEVEKGAWGWRRRIGQPRLRRDA